MVYLCKYSQKSPRRPVTALPTGGVSRWAPNPIGWSLSLFHGFSPSNAENVPAAISGLGVEAERKRLNSRVTDELILGMSFSGAAQNQTGTLAAGQDQLPSFDSSVLL